MKSELPIKLHYQLEPVKRSGFSRLGDLDGAWDRIGYLLFDIYAGLKALWNNK